MVYKVAFIDSIINRSHIKNETDQRRYDTNQFILENLVSCSIYKYHNLNEKTFSTMCDDMRWSYFCLIITHIPYSKEKYQNSQRFFKMFEYKNYFGIKDQLIFAQYEDSLNLVKKLKDKSAGIPIFAYLEADHKDLSDETLMEYEIDFIYRRTDFDFGIKASKYINKILNNIIKK